MGNPSAGTLYSPLTVHKASGLKRLFLPGSYLVHFYQAFLSALILLEFFIRPLRRLNLVCSPLPHPPVFVTLKLDLQR